MGMITTSVQGSIAAISTAVVTSRLRFGPPLYASQAEDAAAMAAKDACTKCYISVWVVFMPGRWLWIKAHEVVRKRCQLEHCAIPHLWLSDARIPLLEVLPCSLRVYAFASGLIPNRDSECSTSKQACGHHRNNLEIVRHPARHKHSLTMSYRIHCPRHRCRCVSQDVCMK